MEDFKHERRMALMKAARSKLNTMTKTKGRVMGYYPSRPKPQMIQQQKTSGGKEKIEEKRKNIEKIESDMIGLMNEYSEAQDSLLKLANNNINDALDRGSQVEDVENDQYDTVTFYLFKASDDLTIGVKFVHAVLTFAWELLYIQETMLTDDQRNYAKAVAREIAVQDPAFVDYLLNMANNILGTDSNLGKIRNQNFAKLKDVLNKMNLFNGWGRTIGDETYGFGFKLKELMDDRILAGYERDYGGVEGREKVGRASIFIQQKERDMFTAMERYEREKDGDDNGSDSGYWFVDSVLKFARDLCLIQPNQLTKEEKKFAENAILGKEMFAKRYSYNRQTTTWTFLPSTAVRLIKQMAQNVNLGKDERLYQKLEKVISTMRLDNVDVDLVGLDMDIEDLVRYRIEAGLEPDPENPTKFVPAQPRIPAPVSVSKPVPAPMQKAEKKKEEPKDILSDNMSDLKKALDAIATLKKDPIVSGNPEKLAPLEEFEKAYLNKKQVLFGQLRMKIWKSGKHLGTLWTALKKIEAARDIIGSVFSNDSEKTDAKKQIQEGSSAATASMENLVEVTKGALDMFGKTASKVEVGAETQNLGNILARVMTLGNMMADSTKRDDVFCEELVDFVSGVPVKYIADV